jgi:hypothetical protein
MKIRKIQYKIEYSHILTFSLHYKDIIAPFFKIPNLSYGFENQGTIDESINLIFKESKCAIQCNKGFVTVIYEGDPEDLKRSESPQMLNFFDILAAISDMSAFGFYTRHSIQAQAVKMYEEGFELNEFQDAKNSKFIKFFPLSNLNEFALTFESGTVNDYRRIQFGNFSQRDIKNFDLTPFKTEHNSDLTSGNSGYMCDIVITEPLSAKSRTKFKELLTLVQTEVRRFDSEI